MCESINNILSEYKNLDEVIYSKVLNIKDELSVRYIDKNLENFNDKVNDFSVGNLHLICLKELYKEEDQNVIQSF